MEIIFNYRIYHCIILQACPAHIYVLFAISLILYGLLNRFWYFVLYRIFHFPVCRPDIRSNIFLSKVFPFTSPVYLNAHNVSMSHIF